MLDSFGIKKFLVFSIALFFVQSSMSQAEELSRFQRAKWQLVSGTATHYFPGSILHSSTATERGKVDMSTETIDLFGDLSGRILYHVRSEFDFVNGTLKNTGIQVFSGTVNGSEPILLLDDDFIFKVNLDSGETRGKVFLTKRLDGHKTECFLNVIGVGFDDQGNGLANYSGRCRVK
uniref:hypothetical protein n=1 Tax=Ningiella ruwaisensis TaxID=2364274 RepID=UPI00109F222E|nr:hypothetical protein [Ningiella ruwaisensis]